MDRNVTFNTPENHPHALSADRVTLVVSILTQKSVDNLLAGNVDAAEAYREAARLIVTAVASNEHETFEQALDQLASTDAYTPAEGENAIIFPNEPWQADDEGDDEPDEAAA